MVFFRNKKLSFSGHESFQCRNLWLKKGYDFVKSGRSFNSEDAVVDLGVGKNMVSSIRYWMKSFGLLTLTEELTPLADRLLSDDGWDPYLEDEGTLWLLHYHLVTVARASTYDLLFNELRRDRIEFTKNNFLTSVKRKAEISRVSVNDSTVLSDFGVFVKMYIRSESQAKDREESFSGLLTELDLVRWGTRNKEEYYVIENTDRRDLPHDIVLYGILSSGQFEYSVNFNTLLTEPDQVGSVFALNATGLYAKLESIIADNADIVFSDQAGIRELSFKTKPDPFTVLAQYYGR
ncbi:DUF4007 family protein [Spirosoma sordidisoli]|uniref:DUF4007 family protein n=1 Tax=Spirosoma sordidisoli TaxID=2502893 RepID=A0A4Q2URK2_9BACT|nr:DUF4007 family protein [Spirosoma sordidisoli]